MKKRILGALLCLCMVMALMPTVAFAGPTSYNLWVGGVEVTSDNASNITGEGITGTVTYDDSTKTLTLNNVGIMGDNSFNNALGTDSAGIYVSNDFNGDLTIKLVGENTITGKLTGSDISSYGIFSKKYSVDLIFDGSGSLNISAADGKAGVLNSWSVAIYSNGSIDVGAQCTITATSGEASNISAAIDCYSLNLNGAKVSAGSSAEDAAVKAENTDSFSPTGYKYIKIEKGDLTPGGNISVVNIAATVTAPALGQTPDYAPVIVANPADSVCLEEVYWYKIAIAAFTGTDEDIWDKMEADEVFEDGYYYSVDLYFSTEDGYKITETTTGTVNGMPHDDTYGGVYDGNSYAYLSGLFEPLELEYTIDLPVSLFVKLTGDKKPAKETFKFEIYDLGCEDAAFEIVNDTVVAENLEFDENGAAFVYGMLKIKVTGQEQLSNLTEGFKVRMVKGTAKGWTYAAEQWYVKPVVYEGLADAAFNIGYDVREIVDGEISEIPANNMNFTVGYEAVTEPETPQTGDNSVMGLWIALLVVSGAGATAIYSRKRKSSAK